LDFFQWHIPEHPVGSFRFVPEGRSPEKMCGNLISVLEAGLKLACLWTGIFSPVCAVIPDIERQKMQRKEERLISMKRSYPQLASDILRAAPPNQILRQIMRAAQVQTILVARGAPALVRPARNAQQAAEEHR
jgi:hypothetical protein